MIIRANCESKGGLSFSEFRIVINSFQESYFIEHSPQLQTFAAFDRKSKGYIDRDDYNHVRYISYINH